MLSWLREHLVHLGLLPLLLVAACVPARQTTPTGPLQSSRPGPSGAIATPGSPFERAGTARVGLLLPLSGSSAALGRDLLDAAQLALFDVGETGLTLLPRDTGETPEEARNAALAAIDAGAELLIGPVFAATTNTVAPIARDRGLTVLSFSNDASVAGRGVFILGFRPEEQVQRIVEYAASRGLTRVGMLAPNDGYGNLVAAEWRRNLAPTLGVNPDAVTLYPPSGDAAGSVRDFVRNFGRPAATAGASAASDFDAVLIADGGYRLRQIAALLAFNDIEPTATRYLGTRRWEEDRSGLRDPALRGGWITSTDSTSEAAFRKRFASAFGREPSAIAALAYDATALAVLLASGNRRFTSESLTDPQGFLGSGGIFRLKQDGTAQHGLAVLEVTADGLRTIDPAPRVFRDVVAAR